MEAIRLGFLASHGGSNVLAIIKAFKEGRLAAAPAVVISNNSGSTALAHARNEGVPAYHMSAKTNPDPADLDSRILQVLEKNGVNLVILAGYMKKIGPNTLNAFNGRILNIHPSLLPRHGGHGMYGQAVHQSVLQSGDTETGVTIHLVNEEYDQGAIVSQFLVPVLPTDTAETLSARVLEQEHLSYVETINRIANRMIDLNTLQ
ncbi:phosphoribosylglycinamide formyltransferase [Paenibacillus sp. MMS18-CY102]|uniref:phosphoribosylglycinamide formyltransferase n=1 Tax=Paenibacillus sp. MMS18-CY102 TaxID=2682849 RepID=UPI0013652A92|nr:phosphoribosylglycinamide formyltransferase [Paenibacillus sp. MMS18-CY102]MWC27661.1 phosphoribosylglycinamide formyltransferase [Paenibacillus sp. MMS18-CY102]